MQWTDGSDRAYGEDPYGGAGYAYAYGHRVADGTTADTATLSWDPVQLAQWPHPTDHPYATSPEPQVSGAPTHGARPDHLPGTGWDAPHGDVLTVPPPEFDTYAVPSVPEFDAYNPSVPEFDTHTLSVPEQDAPEGESERPVFVDSSGRRQRRVLRAARLLVIPAGGYVALLVSTMLGGPSLSSPFVPRPDTTHAATAPGSPAGSGRSTESANPAATQTPSRPATAKTSGPTGRSAASAVPAATSGPTAAPTGVTSPAPAATPAPRGRALGSSHKPVK